MRKEKTGSYKIPSPETKCLKIPFSKGRRPINNVSRIFN